MVVAEKKVSFVIVADEDIHEPIAVVVRDGHAHSLAHMTADATRFRYVGERTIPIVVIQEVRQPFVGRWRTGEAQAVRPTNLIVSEGPIEVINHEQIQPPIIVVIDPGGADGPQLLSAGVAAGDAGTVRDIGKSTVAVIAVEEIAVDACDVKVG